MSQQISRRPRSWNIPQCSHASRACAGKGPRGPTDPAGQSRSPRQPQAREPNSGKAVGGTDGRAGGWGAGAEPPRQEGRAASTGGKEAASAVVSSRQADVVKANK